MCQYPEMTRDVFIQRKRLFAWAPPANKNEFAGAALANKNEFAGATGCFNKTAR